MAALEIKRSKGICRGKSDKTGSKDIAFYALSHLHKLRLSKVSGTLVQQLKLLFAEREKIIRALGSFEKNRKTKIFCQKEVFKTVENINKTGVNQLKTALKKTEGKIMEMIAGNEKIAKQMQLVTSIKGIGKFTAMYLTVCTHGFEKFENWRKLASYAGVAPF